MNCPLMVLGAINHLGKIQFAVGQCEREKCEFWDALRQQCSILTIAQKVGVGGNGSTQK